MRIQHARVHLAALTDVSVAAPPQIGEGLHLFVCTTFVVGELMIFGDSVGKKI